MELYHKFFILFFLTWNISAAEEQLVTVIEQNFQNKLSEGTNYVAKYLEDFNDRHLGNSDIGKILKYDVLKSKFGTKEQEGKGMKKMSMALIPLVFHVGATSTWMIMTSIMAAKSVAIGLALLVFKIAVSSAKVASFFTALKSNHRDHHHDWSWAPPHYEHHGSQHSPWGSEGHYPGTSYKTISSDEGLDEDLGLSGHVPKGPINHS